MKVGSELSHTMGIHVRIASAEADLYEQSEGSHTMVSGLYFVGGSQVVRGPCQSPTFITPVNYLVST